MIGNERNAVAGHVGRRWRGRRRRPPLTVAQILDWADAHHRRTGAWPSARAGPVVEAADTWRAVDGALRSGGRGLPGGDSLARLLRRERGVPERRGGRRDGVRRRQAAGLRAQGLSLAEVGRRLGVSRQAVHALLRRERACSESA
jgi:hypothetical protein